LHLHLSYGPPQDFFMYSGEFTIVLHFRGPGYLVGLRDDVTITPPGYPAATQRCVVPTQPFSYEAIVRLAEAVIYDPLCRRG
jgi:hypothetical protein